MTTPDSGGGTARHEFEHRGRRFQVVVEGDGALSLYCQGVLRKQRAPGSEPLYVWTNVELEWEEHHYVEVRYWPSRGHLQITVNRQPVYAGPVEKPR